MEKNTIFDVKFVIGKLVNSNKWEFLHWDYSNEAIQEWLDMKNIDRSHLKDVKGIIFQCYDNGTCDIIELKKTQNKEIDLK